MTVANCMRVAALSLLLTATLAAPAVAGPAPVGLGTAGSFAVLGGSGLTNTGPTTIVGDVGSAPTPAQTGFGPCPAADCVSLTGTNHFDDAVTLQAKSDLVTAYDDAFGRTGGAAITAPLGAGQTLVPGVYTSASDIFVGGDLTLDGAGDPDAVFIFQAKTGTLTTAAGITNGVPNTRILLTGGAQACNVFWQVGSSATLGTETQFVGTILALSSITVGTRATLQDGRALARDAAVTLDTNTIRSSTCAPPAPAPTGSPAVGGDAGSAGPTGSGGPAGSAGSTGTAGLADPRTLAMATRPGSATLTAPDGTVRGPFTVAVRGREIASVAFAIDGRIVKVVRAIPGRTRFTLKIDPRDQSRRRHRVTVRVRFRARSGSTARVFRFGYRLQPREAPPLRFTG